MSLIQKGGKGKMKTKFMKTILTTLIILSVVIIAFATGFLERARREPPQSKSQMADYRMCESSITQIEFKATQLALLAVINDPRISYSLSEECKLAFRFLSDQYAKAKADADGKKSIKIPYLYARTCYTATRIYSGRIKMKKKEEREKPVLFSERKWQDVL
jgi:hypothetical protein